MKRIIYSIVCALIINVVLALIFPTWFLRGDACRTYLSDTARVDIALIGNVKNSRVTAEGANARISQPAWFSDKTYQGTEVEVPISYRSKSYKIRIVPHAAESGENASLVLTFKGADIRENGKRRPAWVTFQNISLNGQPTAAEKVVWHDRPFLVKFPHNRKITLTFNVCKPLALSDISLKNLLGWFLACLILSLLFTHSKKAMVNILKSIYEKDVVKVVSDGYHHIDPVYRRSFWIIFGVLCFAFGFHTICFMWGNHDWGLLKYPSEWLRHAWEGRYMACSVDVLLSRGVYLPLIYDMVTFVTLALNAVLLCKYWCLEKKVIYFVLCGLVLTAQPFTLSMMYFVDMTPEAFTGVTCALVALILSEKISRGGGSITVKIVYSLIAIVLINFSLAMYQVLLNTIAVAFAGKLLVYAFDWDGSLRQLKSYIRPCMLSVVHVILGVASYKMMITFVFPIQSHYNTDMLPWAQIPERLDMLFKQSFRQLYEYDHPFLPQWILWIFLGITIVLALYIAFTGNIKQKIVRFSLLYGSLFATQTVMIIARTHLIDGRIDLFGLVFYEVLVVSLVITRIRELRNPCVIVGACVIFTSVILAPLKTHH